MIPHINKVDLHTERRDLCAQIPQVGSNDDESPTIARVHGEFLPENGLAENGLHHEICLSEPHRADAAQLKTVLRQPVRRR